MAPRASPPSSPLQAPLGAYDRLAGGQSDTDPESAGLRMHTPGPRCGRSGCDARSRRRGCSGLHSGRPRFASDSLASFVSERTIDVEREALKRQPSFGCGSSQERTSQTIRIRALIWEGPGAFLLGPPGRSVRLSSRSRGAAAIRLQSPRSRQSANGPKTAVCRQELVSPQLLRQTRDARIESSHNRAMAKLRKLLQSTRHDLLHNDFNVSMPSLIKLEIGLDRNISDDELIDIVRKNSRLEPLRIRQVHQVVVETARRSFRTNEGELFKAHRAFAHVRYDGSAILWLMKPPELTWTRPGVVNSASVRIPLYLDTVDPTSELDALLAELIPARRAVCHLDTPALEFVGEIEPQIPDFVRHWAAHYRQLP
jgi:hypothetical protein